MRVLFPFVGDSVGGSHISTALLVKELLERSFDVRVLVHYRGPLSEWLEAEGIPHSILGHPRTVLKGRGQGRKFAQIAWGLSVGAYWLRRSRIDIVHTNDGVMHRTWSFAARAARVPVLWHQRNPFPRSPTLASALVFANRIVSISGYVEASLPPWIRRKSSIVDNPFQVPRSNQTQVRRQLTATLRLTDDVPLIAFVGNLHPRKRPKMLVPLAERLRSYGLSEFAIVVYGSDRNGMRAALENHAGRAQVLKHIKFLGFRSDVQHQLAGCDIVIAPAVHEGFGRTLVEAMMVGTPVVAADSGGHREIVNHGHTGLLFPPDDVNALAAACYELLHDHGYRARLSGEAAREAQTRFSVHAHTDQMLSQYAACLKQRRLHNTSGSWHTGKT